MHKKSVLHCGRFNTVGQGIPTHKKKNYKLTRADWWNCHYKSNEYK